MILRTAIVWIALILLGVCACDRTLTSRSEVLDWKRDNGLVSNQGVGTLMMTCSVILPGERIAGDSLYDGTKLTYLLFSFEPRDSTKRLDVLMDGATSYEEFTRRLVTLAIGDGRNISILLDGRRIRAIGAEMVYDLGLTARKRLIATVPVGLDELSSAESLTVALRDDTFSSSVVAFPLDGSALADLPRVTL